MTTGIFEKHQVHSQTGFEQIAALMISALHPSANENEAASAFRAIRTKVGKGVVDAHMIADRVRGRPSYKAPDEETPPFTAMPPGVRRLWLDAIVLRVRLSEWERRFVADIRPKALSSINRLSAAQTRTLQQMVARAWAAGVRP